MWGQSGKISDHVKVRSQVLALPQQMTISQPTNVRIECYKDEQTVQVTLIKVQVASVAQKMLLLSLSPLCPAAAKIDKPTLFRS